MNNDSGIDVVSSWIRIVGCRLGEDVNDERRGTDVDDGDCVFVSIDNESNYRSKSRHRKITGPAILLLLLLLLVVVVVSQIS